MIHKIDLFLHFQLGLCRRSTYMYSSSLIEVFRKQLLQYCTDVVDLPKSDDKSSIPKNTQATTPKLKHHEAITNYLDSKHYLKKLKSKIPEEYMTRTFVGHTVLFIVDEEVACSIFEKIKGHLKSQKGHVLEVNGAFGVLTEYLLKANIPRLSIYEGDTSMYEDLQVRVLEHKSEAKVFNANLLKLPVLSYLDKTDNGNRVSKLFQHISPLPWEDDAVVNLIVSIPDDKFLVHIVDCIIFQKGICNYGRPDLIVMMPAKLYIKFMSTPSDGFSLYKYKTVIHNIIFKCELLLKVPDKAFLPWLRKKERKLKSSYQPSEDDKDCFFVVKMTARKDLFQHVHPDQLKLLLYFVRTMMKRRKAKFIANMEKIIPGCGVRLIARGLTIFTQCGSLTPEQYLEIFKEFITWPEFKDSSFTSLTDRYFSKKKNAGFAEEMIVESLKRTNKRRKSYVEEEDRDSDNDTEDVEENK